VSHLDLNIEDSTISHNRAFMGGGVFGHLADVQIKNSSLNENHATSHGGAVTTSELKFIESIAFGNTSAESTPGLTADNIEIERSSISSNRGQDHGAAGVRANYTARVTSSSISNNVAGPRGTAGGILADFVFLRNSTVAHNTGLAAGGVYAKGIDAVATTIAYNRATGSGGAGGAFGDSSNLTASILSANHGTSPDCYASNATFSHGYNLIGDASGCKINAHGPGDRAGTAALPLDLRLRPLAHEYLLLALPSVYPVVPLAAGSPAIDAIPRSACHFKHDQRGLSRPHGAGCDIGAYEVGAR
jgi:hypothetical protein